MIPEAFIIMVFADMHMVTWKFVRTSQKELGQSFADRTENYFDCPAGGKAPGSNKINT